MVRGRGNGRSLRLQEDSFGSRGPTNRNPSGFFCGHRVMIKLLTDEASLLSLEREVKEY